MPEANQQELKWTISMPDPDLYRSREYYSYKTINLCLVRLNHKIQQAHSPCAVKL